jgi:excisionase family DNA binding protein
VVILQSRTPLKNPAAAPSGVEVRPFLTVDEAAKFLQCARFTVDKLVNTGVVRYQRLGKKNLIHRGDLLKYLEQHWVKEGAR